MWTVSSHWSKRSSTLSPADPEWADKFMEEARVLGVEELTESTMVVRSVVKARPTERWTVKREGYRRLKLALDRAGVPIHSI